MWVLVLLNIAFWLFSLKCLSVPVVVGQHIILNMTPKITFTKKIIKFETNINKYKHEW